MIAQALAYYHEPRVASMVLIASAPDYSYASGNLHELVHQLRVAPSRQLRDRLSELFFSEKPSIEFKKYLATMLLPLSGYAYPFSVEAQTFQDEVLANWRSNQQRLAELDLAVLIACAKNDEITKPSASLLLHQLIPHSHLISYPRGGHFFMHYFPTQLAHQVTTFLTSTPLE